MSTPAHADPSPLQPISRTAAAGRTSDLVLRELTSAIRENRLPPGALLSETDLATRLGVSRTPVREAVASLVSQRLLRVTPQVGTSVALIDAVEVKEAVFVRSALEVAAFRIACHADVAARDLHGILRSQRAATRAQDASGFFEADERLHASIFEIAEYPHVWTVVRNAKVQLDRVRHLVLSDVLHTHQLEEEHGEIVRCLEAGDEERGVEVVERHAHHVMELLPGVRARFPAFFV